MCGRYVITLPPAAIVRIVRASGETPNLAPHWNAAPTQDLPVLRRHPETGERHLGLLRWGLVPGWSKSPKDGVKAINARSETAATQPLFRAAFAKRRCLVPANAWYEWHGAAKAKQPFAIAVPGVELFCFAGLWEAWRDSASGEILRSFTILTAEAAPQIAHLHGRMPVVLAPDDYAAWLAPETQAGAAQALLGPWPHDLDFWPVDPRVGNVRNDDADLIERVG